MRSLVLLVGSAILAVATTSCFATIAILSGATIASQPPMASIPYALYFVGLVTSTIVTARIASSRGRRHALMLAQIVGLAGAALAAVSLELGMFPLLCLATAMIGYFAGAATSTRFFAAELAGPERATRAIGMVMGSSIIGGLAGPMISAFAGLSAAGLVLSYFMIAILIATSVALVGLIPASRPTGQSVVPVARGIVQLFGNRVLRHAALANMLAWVLMSSIMGAAPALMRQQGISQHLIGASMQVHFLAMYIPAVLAMALGGRMYSRGTSLWAGLATLLLGCAASLIMGVTTGAFIVALSCAGLGWGLVIVTNSVVFAAVPLEKRLACQGANDFLSFSASALAALGSGGLVAAGGWPSLAIVGVIALALYAGYLLVSRAIGAKATSAS